MTIAKRLALLEARRVKAGWPDALHPALMRWLADFHQSHGSYASALVTAADLALWADLAPTIDLYHLLDRFARVDATI